MRFLHLLLLLPVVFYLLDAQLPRFYIFDPKKLQEISQESIRVANGNTTVLFEHLTKSLQEEYGEKHINNLDRDAWFFK